MLSTVGTPEAGQGPGVMEEVASEQRPGCSEGQSHETIGKNTSCAQGRACAKFPGRAQRLVRRVRSAGRGDGTGEGGGAAGARPHATAEAAGPWGVRPRPLGVRHREGRDLTVPHAGSPRLPCASSLWFRKQRPGAPLQAIAIVQERKDGGDPERKR